MVMWRGHSKPKTGPAECGVKDDLMFAFMVLILWLELNTMQNSFVALEHRFYGESIPFGDLGLLNLKYLSAEQALVDIADFITSLNKDMKDRKVVVIGGGYPGALSTWFREKFPNYAIASWSSSGLVYPKEDFWEFDQ